ncbi:MAG: nicotinate-nucleotide adenylyltransferase [Acetatifactor sp.]
MLKVGILGGTFNPIHTGHLLLAEWAMDTLGLDEVWLLPSGVSYMKNGEDVLPSEERLHMTELAVSGNKRFRCLNTEAHRPGNSYTFETLEELKGANPGTEFFFITGSDCLFGIEAWREPERIFAACTLVVADRGFVTEEEMKQKQEELKKRFGARIILIKLPRIDISSTMVRRRVAEGKSIRYLVPECVLKYIDEKGFYRG